LGQQDRRRDGCADRASRSAAQGRLGKLIAHLDAQHEKWAIDEPQCASARNAIAAWNLLSNGMGGIDWHGLPLVVARLGIADVEALIDDLGAIKTWQPPGKRKDPEAEDDEQLEQ
jgi:hypothetical protein